jgi:catechol 2,3-dioxygenase-like lactoylglutathione lyase family enzyme
VLRRLRARVEADTSTEWATARSTEGSIARVQRTFIKGVNQVTLAVRDLAESMRFYGEVLGLRLVARWPRGAYFAAGDLWLALQLDPMARSGPLPEYTHVALTVEPSDFDGLADRIRTAGATIWQDNRSEGASLYFLDPTGHKLEIHASDLAARLRSARERPWEGLEVLL